MLGLWLPRTKGYKYRGASRCNSLFRDSSSLPLSNKHSQVSSQKSPPAPSMDSEAILTGSYYHFAYTVLHEREKR